MKFTYYECLTTQWALQRNIKEIARLLKNIYTKYPDEIEWNSTKNLIYECQTNLQVLRKLRKIEKEL